MRRYIGIAAGLGLLLVALTVTNAGPALAQGALKPVMALITNDVEHPVPVLVTNTTATPALEPFRASLDFTFVALNSSRLVTTVPADKRLVVQHVSYSTSSVNANQFVFGALRNGQLGPLALMLQINPPHASAAVSSSIQDGSMPTTVYFEPGEEVWLAVTKNEGADRQFNFQISGYFITITP